MNTHIDFETAKLLKEKGFNEPCYYCYDNDGDNKNLEDIWQQGCEGGMSLDDWNVQYNLPHFNLIAKPTIAEVVMWLYEKHGIWISLDAGINGFHAHYKVHPIGTLSSNLKQGWINKQSNPLSIIAAYTGAIQYCLIKLIK